MNSHGVISLDYFKYAILGLDEKMLSHYLCRIRKKDMIMWNIKKGDFMFRSSLFLCFCRIFKIEDRVFC